MTTMELEAQRASLAREILNTDSKEMLDEMTKTVKRIKKRLARPRPVKGTVMAEATEYKGDTREEIIANLRETALWLKDFKAGRAKGIPVDELVAELNQKDYD